MPTQKTKTNPLTYVWEFIKLQLAGNILFVGTMAGFFIGEHLLKAPLLPSLIVAGVLAHIIFFIVNRNWVFAVDDAAPNRQTMWRFGLFMGLNFVLSVLLIELFAYTLRQTPDASITTTLYSLWTHLTSWLTPGTLTENWQYYVAQVLSGLVFSVWSFVGLRFWVFPSSRPYVEASRHHALTLRSKRQQPAK